ncbi:hypothetical protein [Haloechinothrix sp. LS1_15]|uniref:hypothetical protein n=1 Tax=Haloechinothrix sp. LS1_15 TaxID=2652248 RepID=UPI0029488EE9|nr:hypothetical protein [Haloechinothrix sp. LS1_15]MDV6011827.1 hypothetical protein [Haloechinothrix sp. LS1_15]
MTHSPEPDPLRVLIVSERPELPPTLHVGSLAVRELDSDRIAAARAAEVLRAVTLRLFAWEDELRRACSALDEATTSSERAKTARAHLASALTLTDDLCGEVNDARDALDFHWP